MPAPTGIVTFVFTDVERSTPLWQALPGPTKEALALHDAVLRQVFEKHHGYEFGTAGDSFKYAFADPCDAIVACVEAQVALLPASWPEELLAHAAAAELRGPSGALLHRGLRVRMGIHLGPVEHFVNATTGRTDYLGTTVNEAARVGDAGHGGQIVITRPAWETAHQAGNLGVIATPLGDHQLRGIDAPEALIQLLPTSLAGRSFPPLRTETARRSNVVARRDAFLGREAEVTELLASLQQHRLTTLLGIGGTGKTRLATELALEHAARWPGGTWFCDLATARNRMDVLVLLATALEAPLPVDVDDATASGTSGRVIAGLGEALLILDNFEQVVPHAADTVGRWLDAAPAVRFLVTSREPLGLSGERRIELAPLETDAGVALFVERARLVRPEFQVDPSDRELLTSLVKQLDAMPLAIELAASRVDVLSVSALARRLDQRFRLLQGQRPDRGRRSTLRGAIDWSWDLLAPVEREALRQCAVFRGGFDVDAAEAVLDLGAFEDAPWALDVVQALRRKSLLREMPGPGARLGMYETILAYAGDRLGSGPERDAAELRHAGYFAALAERCAAGMRLPGDIERFATLRAELDNLLAVHQRMRDQQPALAARVIASIAPALEVFGPAPHFLEMIEVSIAGAERAGDPELLVRVLRGKAFALGLAARPRERNEVLLRALAIAEEHHLDLHVAEVHREHGLGAFYGVVPVDDAVVEIGKARDVLFALGHPALASLAWLILENLTFFARGTDEVTGGVAKALQSLREHAGERDVAWSSQTLGNMALWGKVPIDLGATALHQATLVMRRCGDRLNLAGLLAMLGALEALRGNEASAEACFDEAEQLIGPMATPGRKAQALLFREIATLRQAADARQAGEMERSASLLAGMDARIAWVFEPGPDTPGAAEGGAPLAVRSPAVQAATLAIMVVRSTLEDDPTFGRA